MSNPIELARLGLTSTADEDDCTLLFPDLTPAVLEPADPPRCAPSSAPALPLAWQDEEVEDDDEDEMIGFDDDDEDDDDYDDDYDDEDYDDLDDGLYDDDDEYDDEEE